jgi:hypothetical protein
MGLVEDVKECWKWVSMWCMTLAGTVQGAWAYLPEDMKASIPTGVIQGITVALLVLGMAGRVIKQPKRRNDDG